MRREDFEPIYDQVATKLASWKGKLRNKPGRLTLANVVLTSIPSYAMQIQWFPQYACDRLDRTVRAFLWQGAQDKAMHMVSWKKVTRARIHGGLGVFSARFQNVALLGKLSWNLIQHSDKLWVTLLSDKYLKEGDLFLDIAKAGSPTWRAILKSLEWLQESFSFKIGDGNTNIWFRPWLCKQPLCDLVPDIAPQ